MASIKLIFKENKIDSNGEIPLYIRIIKDRKTRFISIGVKLKPELWDDKENVVKKKHPNSARLNAFITQKIADANDVAVTLETNKRNRVSSKKIKEKILGKPAVSFKDYFKDYLDTLKIKGHTGTYDKANSTYSKLNQYLKGNDLMFDEIDLHFLKKYESYLQNVLKNKNNTIHSNLKIFRKLFNDAVREDLIEPNANPFSKFKLSWEKTNKEYLTEEELLAIENVELTENTMMFHHRNAYVFAAFAGGIRISDIFQLKWNNYDGTHIRFKAQKTDDLIQVKLPQKAKDIIEYYSTDSKQRKSNQYIFPFLDNDMDYSDPFLLFKTISSNTAYANKNLKFIAEKSEINKNISFHSSRHTWATRALRKGMRIEYVSKLMGHSTIKTTQVYTKIVNSELDKAMDVFD